LNKEAMEMLRQNDTSSALALLNKAQELLQDINLDNQVWAVTFNNFGCYFKKTEDFTTSLQNFKKALEIFNKRPSEVLSISGTLLNITSVHSEMNNHEKALKTAQKALKTLLSSQDKSENIYTSTVISYHNIANEYGKLGKKFEAFEYFRLGWELAKEKLGKSHQLTLCMKKSAFAPCYLRNSSTINQDKGHSRVLKFRSNSSNANSRVKFPKVRKRLITPTKENYKNLKIVEKVQNRTMTLPDKQVSALNSLVKEIEMTLEARPRKYVFKRNGEVDGLEGTNGDNRYLQGILKFPSIFSHVSESPGIRNLQIIPESVNEDKFEAKPVSKNRTFQKNIP